MESTLEATENKIQTIDFIVWTIVERFWDSTWNEQQQSQRFVHYSRANC